MSGKPKTPEDAYLVKRPENPNYHARITVDRGAKVVGKCLETSLGTKDLTEARKLRDAMVRCLYRRGHLSERVARQALDFGVLKLDD